MTSRSDVNLLTAAQKRLVSLAQGEIASFFGTLDLTRPEAVRDALLEIVPSLVREYGELAAVAAAEWYENVRPGNFTARTSGQVSVEQVSSAVRFSAGHLFGDDPAAALAVLAGSIQRFVAYGVRATVARNVQLDPLKPRFARVPSGAKTCAWCSMLASRGFVYYSKKSAGIIAEDYHNDCDCAVVASFDAEPEHIAGYDPDRLYDMYQEARASAGSGDQKKIAAHMRRLFPGEFTDGVHAHEI